MKQELAQISLLVRDYDEAIAFYTQQLNFDLISDEKRSESKRWVVVCPKGSACSILLAKATNKEQENTIGNQTGGRVFLFLYTDDIQRDYKQFQINKVEIVRAPSEADFGSALVFKDLYGNLWDLIQLKK